MMRVNVKDKVDSYMMIPVWDFFGYYVDKFKDDYVDENQIGLNENNEVKFEWDEPYGILTINTIDGSIIDRALGY